MQENSLTELNTETKNPEISIVLPCYNEDLLIEDFLRYLAEELRKLRMTFEIVAVDDGSKDKTGDILVSLKNEIPELTVIRFSRNFGHMAALTAGLQNARAYGAVISMDSDGQHPPELLPELIRHWKQGADIVQTVRRETADAGLKKRLTSKMFYWVLNNLGNTPIVPGAADFRLMSRQAVDSLNSLPESSRFIRGLVFWIGYKMVMVEFDAPARIAGTSKYSFIKMLQFALDGVISFSSSLLRLSVLLGMISIMISFLYTVSILIGYLLSRESFVSGWSSLMIMIMFFSGVNMIILGIVGEYIGRIYDESKKRPLYIIKEKR